MEKAPVATKKVNDVLADAALFDFSPESIGLPLRELSFLLFEHRFYGVDTLAMTPIIINYEMN